MIGNKNKEDKLHYLYCEITRGLDIVLENFDTMRPFFIKQKWVIILLTLPFFMILELLLK